MNYFRLNFVNTNANLKNMRTRPKLNPLLKMGGYKNVELRKEFDIENFCWQFAPHGWIMWQHWKNIKEMRMNWRSVIYYASLIPQKYKWKGFLLSTFVLYIQVNNMYYAVLRLFYKGVEFVYCCCSGLYWSNCLT